MTPEDDRGPGARREGDDPEERAAAPRPGPVDEGPADDDVRAVADAALQRMREARLGAPRMSVRPRRRSTVGSGGTSLPRGGTRWTKAPGLAASRTRWDEPTVLGAVIGRVGHQRGWDGPAAMGSVMARWPVIVGADLSEHCDVETFEDHRLIVRCSSTAWAKQLQLLLPHIERRIDEEVGPGVVTQVVVRGPAAPSWRRGRYSVPGRGPRDTYG